MATRAEEVHANTAKGKMPNRRDLSELLLHKTLEKHTGNSKLFKLQEPLLTSHIKRDTYVVNPNEMAF